MWLLFMTSTDAKLCFLNHNQGDSGEHVSLLIALNERGVHIQPIIWHTVGNEH